MAQLDINTTTNDINHTNGSTHSAHTSAILNPIKPLSPPTTEDSSGDALNASPPHKLYKISSTPQTPPLPYYGVWNIPPYYPTPSYYSPHVTTQPMTYPPPTTFVNNLLDYPIEPSPLQLSRYHSPGLGVLHAPPPPLFTTSPSTSSASTTTTALAEPTNSLPVYRDLEKLTVSFPNHDTLEAPVAVSTIPSVVAATSSQNNVIESDPSPGGAMAPPMPDSKYIDITEYLNLPQSQAAKKLHVPTSTLSKRWKDAVRTRKWPYRAVCKLDKEIMTILYNIPQSGETQSDDLPPDVKAKLGRLLRERQDLLRPVFIRL